ncbi:hypothetical protein [Panacibacter ginsenosidivorans]|nr:hypothetical protein [Panacibacter ginsenosidivorans]
MDELNIGAAIKLSLCHSLVRSAVNSSFIIKTKNAGRGKMLSIKT